MQTIGPLTKHQDEFDHAHACDHENLMPTITCLLMHAHRSRDSLTHPRTRPTRTWKRRMYLTSTRTTRPIQYPCQDTEHF
jgi:hypothetical protein